ncbi:MAG: DUF72 domain-containing protein [Chloroflexi bacterium]|nr:DUF72 domain-containing protein [Chloroflexota bacterium]
MNYLGTSGFSYLDWVGNFYPKGLPRHEWLAYYSREFNTCEVNSTFYALPRPANLRAMAEKTPEGFLFSVKANQEMTHRREDASVFQDFCRALEPIISAGKLGCILAQFPYSFRLTRENWDYLRYLRDRLAGLPVVIEFRNVQWIKDEVFGWLRFLDLGFCCVDEPQLPRLLPPIAEATAKISYVRLHGRNSEKWWKHEQAYERYDYSYSPEELTEWVPKIRKLDGLSEKTFVFANNHWRAQAVSTVRQLRALLD